MNHFTSLLAACALFGCSSGADPGGADTDSGGLVDDAADSGATDAAGDSGTDSAADTTPPPEDTAKPDAPSVGKKWFPGHYLYQAADDYSIDSKEFSVLKGADGALFRGLFMYVTWGQIETTKGTYRWDKIDGVLAALPKGKKLAVSLSWQAWQPVTPLQACPADLLGKAEYDDGQHLKDGRPFATIYMTSTMSRYLDWTRRFAERYDGDERLALAVTAEIPFESSVKGPKYDDATAIANMMRLPSEMFPAFKRTPSGALGAWWSFGSGESASKFAKAVYDAGAGFGFPDLLGPGSEHYESHYREEVTKRAGTWASWMGMEWADYVSPRALTPFPATQLTSAKTTKTNFVWWGTYNRVGAGGYSFNDHVLPLLRKSPLEGITTACPTNMVCAP